MNTNAAGRSGVVPSAAYFLAEDGRQIGVLSMAFGKIFLGRTGKGKKRYVELSNHALTVAGSGADIGSHHIIPNLLEWPDSVVVIDPTGDAANLTAEHRRDVLGQKVAVFDPFGYSSVPKELRKTFNPLDCVETYCDIYMISEGLILRSRQEAERDWDDYAQMLIEGCLDLILSYSIPKQDKSLVTLWRFLTQLQDRALVTPDESKSTTL